MKRIVLVAALLLSFCITANAQMIGATNNNPTVRTNNSPLHHPTGSALRFEAGFPLLFSISYVNHVSPYFMIGGGTGLGMYGYDYSIWNYRKPSNSYTYYLYDSYSDREYDFGCMPLFAEAELHTPRYKWSLFINVKAGYNLFHPDDYYYSDPRDESYRYYDYAYDYERKCDRFFFMASVGFSYKNFSFGAGYSTTYFLNSYLSYNLPIKSITSAISRTLL